MNFEHLIAINDPANPLLVMLSRQQVWDGLMARVENPVPFLPGLESCRILERGEKGWRRELDFGAARIIDRVTLDIGHWVRFDIEPGEQHAGGSLTIRIEEPAATHLFLRFAYETTLGRDAPPEEQGLIEYVKSAYQQSDIDCVRIIRTLAAGGSAQ